MKIYTWSKNSKVFHRRLFTTEQCNKDDRAVRIESNEPPADRTYCKHCQKRQEWATENEPIFQTSGYVEALKEMDRIRAEERVMHYGGQDS